MFTVIASSAVSDVAQSNDPWSKLVTKAPLIIHSETMSPTGPKRFRGDIFFVEV